MDWEQSPRFTTADLGFVQSLPSGFFYLNEQYSSLMLTTGGLLWTSLSFIDAVPSSTNGAVWIRVPRGLEKTILSSKRTTYRPSKQNYILQKDNLIWSHNFAKKAEKNYLLKTSIVPWWPPWLRRSWLSWSCCWNSWSSCFFKRFCASCSWLLSLSFSSSSLCACSLRNSISFDFSANISSSLDKSSLYYEGKGFVV